MTKYFEEFLKDRKKRSTKAKSRSRVQQNYSSEREKISLRQEQFWESSRCTGQGQREGGFPVETDSLKIQLSNYIHPKEILILYTGTCV